LFCAVSNTGTGDRVMTSPDGTNWTIQASAANDGWVALTWSSELGLFCAVSSVGTIMTSSDGLSWATQTTPTANDYRGISWSPQLSLFCVVSISGIGNRVMTSPDGTNWTSRVSAVDNDWFSVSWSPELGLFCAVSFSGNRVMTSDNDFSAYVQTSSYGTQAVTDISVVGKDITIGQSANNVTIGNYAGNVTIGSPGVPISILGTLMGIAYLRQEKPYTSNAGSNLANVVQVRVLNTIDTYGNINCSLVGNQFTLGAGSYWMIASAPAFDTGRHRTFIYNVTDSTYDLTGTSQYCEGREQTISILSGFITIASSKVFELQHYTQTLGGSGNGLGVGTTADSGTSQNNVFGRVTIYRLF
jgi:hypothetical protein